MKIYYRGYVIDEEIRSISYAVYGPRPVRVEVSAQPDARAAMQWIDQDVTRQSVRGQNWPQPQPLLV